MTAKKLQKSDGDYVSNKVLTMFLLALVGVFILMLVYRLLTHGSTFMYGLYSVKALLLVGVSGALYGVFAYARERKGKQEGKRKIISSANIIVIGLTMAFCSAALLYYDFTVSIKVLYILLPVMALLYLVFHTYPREFFSISVICSTGAPFLWLLSRSLSEDSGGKRPLYILVAGLVLMGIELAVVLKASKNKGTVSVFRRKLMLLSQDANLLPILLCSLVVVLSLALSFTFGAVFAFYCMSAIFGYLFLSAVYYTVKLM